MNRDKPRFRYYADLRHGAFIFVTIDGIGWPPHGYPVVEMSADEVKAYLFPPEEE